MAVDVIRRRHRELQDLSLHYSHISSLLSYATETLSHMSEAWEDVLLTMDIKLAQYSTVRTLVRENFLFLFCFLFSDFERRSQRGRRTAGFTGLWEGKVSILLVI